MKQPYFIGMLCLLTLHLSYGQSDLRVQILNGTLEGVGDTSGIRCFKGIPFAAAPVGALRWKEPQPVRNWKGIRRADQFGARPMQRGQIRDMVFRSKKISEDCLYLNVWTPQAGRGPDTGNIRMPVLVYFHGGGLYAGDGSELRYDGASMARKGIVMVTVNYRLGIFGFFAHPELTAGSSRHASGNYGFLDQVAALRWVHENIAAFGGDPGRVTIAGQSAGSMSVSALMASPLSRGLFAGAIGESSSILGPMAAMPLADAEGNGLRFAQSLQAYSIGDLRSLSADSLLAASAARSGFRFSAIVDGYFLPQTPIAIYSAGRQADVPLLAGWNSAELPWQALLRQSAPTPEIYRIALQELFGPRADEAAELYKGTTEQEVMNAATDLAGDRFLGYSTWKWLDLHGKTAGRPVYRYLYRQPLPPMTGQAAAPSLPPGAPHSAEIAYALGNLSVYNIYAWTREDQDVSAAMQAYFVNFIKTGDPNGPGLAPWSAFTGNMPQVMLIGKDTHQEPEKNKARYLFLDAIYDK